MKKNFLTGLTVILLSMGLILAGCEGPTGADGASGGGTPGDTVLSGKVSEAAVRYALASDKPVVFAGAAVYGDGVSSAISAPLVIDRAVTLVANSPALDVNGTLVIGANASFSRPSGTSGKIKATTLVAPAAVVAADDSVVDPTSGTIVPASSGGVIAVGANTAVAGNVTISSAATSATNIINNASITNLYVIGNLTVSDAVTSIVNIDVTGNITATAGITATSVSVGKTLSTTGALGVTNVYGSVSFSGEAASISAATTLHGNAAVPVGGTLTVDAGKTLTVNGTLGVAGTLEIGAGTDGAIGNVGNLAGTGTVNVTGAIVGGIATTNPQANTTDTIGAWWASNNLAVVFAPGSRLNQRNEDFLGTAGSPTIRNTITGSGAGLKWTGKNIEVTANTTFTTLRGFVVSNGQTITVNGNVIVKTEPGHENHQWDGSHAELYAVDSPLEIHSGGIITIGTTGTLKGTGEASWLDGSLYSGSGAVPGIAGTINHLAANGTYSGSNVVVTGTAYVWQGAWVADASKDNTSAWLNP